MTCVFSQTEDVYGKRFQLTFGAGGNINAFSRLVNGHERRFRKSDKYSELRQKTPNGLFNYSFHATVGYSMKERSVLSLDLNYLNSNALMLYSYSKYANAYEFRFNFQSFRFMPRIEINTINSTSSSGFIHIIGVGVEFNLATSKNYHYHFYPIQNNSTVKVLKYEKVHFSMIPQITISLLYGTEYRIPLSAWAALNFGGYFNFNFAPDFMFNSREYEDFSMKTDRLMSKSRFQNLFNLRTGLIIML